MAKKAPAPAAALSADQLAMVKERDAILVWLKPAQARELEIRNALAAALFPSPVEGINNIITADGYEVSLDHKINRKLDEAALDTVMMELPENSPARTPGVLIVYKPALVLSGYRSLPEDQLKVFQQALTETPGAPSLTIGRVGDSTGGSPGENVSAYENCKPAATPIMDKYEAEKQKVTRSAVRKQTREVKAASKPKKKGKK